MSIFTKITVLFSISLALMIGIGYQIEKINSQKYESIVIQKYLLDGRKIFAWMATSSQSELQDRLKSLNLQSVALLDTKRLVMKQSHTFGLFEIYETEEETYILHIRYIDEDLFLQDTTLEASKREGWLLSYLVMADIAVLILIFIIIFRMLSPLRSIASSMRRFAAGEYGSRSEVQSSDEIAEVALTYNEMAQKIENLILARQDLLRNVGHELRTPIARGLFALEQIEPSKSHDILKNSFNELDQLTRELLEIEKLRSSGTLQCERFSAETLIVEALGKLSLVDESAVEVKIESNFTLEGDLGYLSLALKNLIDNAVKYAERLPITVEVSENRIRICNDGAPMEKEYTHFMTPFTRQEQSRTTAGFGLGLDIVTKIIDKHPLALTYEYLEGRHCFSIIRKDANGV